VPPHGYIPPDRLDPRFLERAAEQRLAAVLNEALGADARVPVEAVTREGSAADALVAAAEEAELLVVGTRGRGVLGDVVLGSVSRACIQRACCPVVVVRPDAPART